MMMMKSVIWWRKPEYPEETTDLRQVTDETFHRLGILGRTGSMVFYGCLVLFSSSSISPHISQMRSVYVFRMCPHWIFVL